MVAPQLLSATLYCQTSQGLVSAQVWEVEAYLGSQDLASHARFGVTPRTKTLFGPPGTAYVYFIYGRYYCFNVVVQRKGLGEAILIRGLKSISHPELRLQGPGLLTQALDITKEYSGQDLTSSASPVFFSGPITPVKYCRTPRIGVAYAGSWSQKPYRFLRL